MVDLAIRGIEVEPNPPSLDEVETAILLDRFYRVGTLSGREAIAARAEG